MKFRPKNSPGDVYDYEWSKKVQIVFCTNEKHESKMYRIPHWNISWCVHDYVCTSFGSNKIHSGHVTDDHALLPNSRSTIPIKQSMSVQWWDSFFIVNYILIITIILCYFLSFRLFESLWFCDVSFFNAVWITFDLIGIDGGGMFRKLWDSMILSLGSDDWHWFILYSLIYRPIIFPMNHN